ncbi:MAG: hypothetical protein ACK4M3_07740, partial [Pyrobaculum sp.]
REAVGRNLTLSLQAPGGGRLWIRVNGSLYAVDLSVELAAPRITIRDVSRIEFNDSRQLQQLMVSCTSEISITFTFDLLNVRGTLWYTPDGKKGEGYITLRFDRDYTGGFSGFLGPSGGYVDIDMAGRRLHADLDAGGNVRRVTIDGREYSCSFPRQLVPSIFLAGKPTADREDVWSYARMFLSAFAKVNDERPQDAVWNGEYVEVRDRGGRSYRVYIREDRVEVSGSLAVVVYFS